VARLGALLFATLTMARNTTKLSEQTSEHYSDLQRQFRTLSRNYLDAVFGSIQRRRDASDLFAMATWALRASGMACALVRDGKIRLTNQAFDRLDRGSSIGPGWQRSSLETQPDEDQAGRPLAAIVLEEALLLADGPGVRRRARLSRGPQTVELTVERPLAGPTEPRTALALARETTEVSQAEAQMAAMRTRLLERERAGVVSQLAVGVAHDLGNLVGAMRARLSVLVGPSDDATRAQAAHAIRTIVDAQTALVSKLRNVGRPRADVAAPVRLFEDVVEPAAQMAEGALRFRDRGRPIQVRVDPAVAGLPAVQGVRDDLMNVVVNLFLNARDAMPGGGQILVSGERLGAEVLLRVEDEGTGIPDEALGRLFQPFFSTKGSAGLGVGLSMAADVMRRVGGNINARNRPEGGACFELHFVASSAPPTGGP
jgi:signal transduction histidine kinase